MSDNKPDSRKKLIPFFPDYILDEMIAWYIALAVLIVLASLLPAGLEEHANPLETPAHVKPEWYFLFLYQTLKLVPRIVGGFLIPAVGVGLLFLLPFIDRKPHKTWRDRAVPIAIAIVVTVAVVGLTLWGWLS
jgi:quinol-cytochrome oxidoreductase complex cytochrome b subunit